MSNFLENLVIPQLGSPTFQNDFEAFCSVIKNNFERLVSVQFTKGNDGNSVVTQKITIGQGLREDDVMPNLVYQIVKSIYNLGDTPMTIGAFKQLLEGTYNQFGDPNSGGIAPSFYDAYSFPQLQTIPTQGIDVDIVLDEHNGKAYMAVPYIFIDGRISELSRYKREHADDDIYKTFHDYSTAVFGEGEFISNVQGIQDWNWETNSIDIVPKLYFDDTIGEFCWEVNGQRTGVTAQGVKGNDGIASHVYTAKGVRNDNRITIEAIQYANDDGIIYWFDKKERLEDIKNYVDGEETIIRSVKFSDNEGQTNASIILRDTDFLLVFYRNGEDPESPYDKAFLGKPYMEVDPSSTWIYVYYEEEYDIFQNILDQNFRDMLNGIYDSNNIADLRGIYIPGRSSNGEQTSNYHMTYSESPSKIHSAIVDYNSTQGNVDEPVTQEIGDWWIDYNTQVQGTLGVQGNVTMRNDACVQGNLNVQGNIEASSINVTGEPFRSIQDLRPAVVSQIKNISYSILRNTTNSTSGPSTKLPTSFGYTISMTATLNVKIGMMSFSQGDNIDNTNINRQMHKMIGRYGQPYGEEYYEDISQYGYMWYDGNSSVIQSIQTDSSTITNNDYFHNAPKLYDVVEYNIPISLTRQTNYICDIMIDSDPQSGSAIGNTIGHYYISPAKDIDQLYSYEFPQLQQVVGFFNGNPQRFNDVSYNILLQGVQESSYIQPGQLNYISGNNIDMEDVDNYVQGYNTNNVFIRGALSRLVWNFTHQYDNNGTPYYFGYPGTFTFEGSLDYKGNTLNYYIDFFIAIQEIIGRNIHYDISTLQPDGFEFSNESNVQVNIIPVGYIEGFNGFKTPIYGAIPIDNATPSNTPSLKIRKLLK